MKKGNYPISQTEINDIAREVLTDGSAALKHISLMQMEDMKNSIPFTEIANVKQDKAIRLYKDIDYEFNNRRFFIIVDSTYTAYEPVMLTFITGVDIDNTFHIKETHTDVEFFDPPFIPHTAVTKKSFSASTIVDVLDNDVYHEFISHESLIEVFELVDLYKQSLEEFIKINPNLKPGNPYITYLEKINRIYPEFKERFIKTLKISHNEHLMMTPLERLINAMNTGDFTHVR